MIISLSSLIGGSAVTTADLQLATKACYTCLVEHILKARDVFSDAG